VTTRALEGLRPKPPVQLPLLSPPTITRPMVVMTATQHPWGLGDAENARLNGAWNAGQDHWLSLSSSARLVPVDNTGHDIHVDQPEAVIERIQQLLR
jgi:pimeloyl-ACP methyl ester carboxylesterase